MNTITAITVICFSPTHTSRKIAEAVAAGMDGIYCGSGEGTGATASCPGTVKTIDLTLDRSEEPVILAQGEAVVIGAPVYAGRVAPYGNRDYEDALVELYDLAVSLGLSPFAAGAFIGEHSYSTPEMPVAVGRPDSMDIADARIFGGQCRQKLDGPGAFAPFSIKGNRPYKEPSRPASDTSRTAQSSSGSPAKPAPSVPLTTDGCPLCGECVRVCPTGAVSIDLNVRKVLTDHTLCIHCCACVRACPAGLRTYTTPFTAFLHEHCSARRDPETFL